MGTPRPASTTTAAARRALRTLALVAVLATASVLPVTSLAGQAAAPLRAASDSSGVVAVVQAFHRALETGDSLAALALLAPDVVVLESGDVESRADYRAHHLAADIAFAKGAPAKRSPIAATVVGDAAWARSTTVSVGTFNGRAINSAGAELMVLSRDAAGAWRIRAIHWSSRTRRAQAGG